MPDDGLPPVTDPAAAAAAMMEELQRSNPQLAMLAQMMQARAIVPQEVSDDLSDEVAELANRLAQAESRIERFSPAFWRTLLPGCSRFPRAERVIAWTRRSSTTTSPCLVVSRCAVWCAKSARRWRTRSSTRPIARTVRRRRLEPRCWRASRR